MLSKTSATRSARLLAHLALASLLVGTLSVAAGVVVAQAESLLPDLSHETRFDPSLRMLMQRAGDPVNAAAALDAATAAPRQIDMEPVPANLTPDSIEPASVVGLMIEGNPDPAQLAALGASVGTIAGGWISAVAPLARVPDLLAVPGVERIQASSVLHPQLNVSVPEMDAPDLWQTSPPNITGYSGRNVIVGIVDAGVDLTHDDLKNANGTTRVKYAWDQTWVGTRPAGFNYGAEYTESQINAGQASNLRDDDGHGTHLAGIAAGNGRATGNGQPAYRYVGVAPNADLIVVKAYSIDNYILDACNYVFQKATALGRPAVINLSYGTLKGGHDGSYSLDAALSALTGPGRIIVAAAGNYGNVPFHAQTNITSNNGSNALTFTVPTYTGTSSSLESISIEGWYNPGAIFDVRVTSPTGFQTATISSGTTSGALSTNDGMIQIDNGVTTNSKGGKVIAIAIWRGNSTLPHPAIGTWTVTVTRKSGSSHGLADWWITAYKFPTTTTPAFTGQYMSYARSITSPATADSVIATGAYITKVSWLNAFGQTSLYPGSPQLENLADFSSIGPRRDGVTRPDVAAPGYGVMSSLASTVMISDNYKDPDKVHFMQKGTSMASAHTAGAIALLLEQTTNLTPSGARRTLQSRARGDAYATNLPNSSWGWGKLDVSPAGTTDVADHFSNNLEFSAVFPNPSAQRSTFSFNIGAASLSQGARTTVQVRIIDAAGREVTALPGLAQAGPQVVTWNGRDARGAKVGPGVYFARVEVGPEFTVRKFVRTAE